jgi:hypothetical protein
MSVAEIAKDAGAGAGALSLCWNVARYRLDRRVALRVSAAYELRGGQGGIRVSVANRSPEREVRVRDVEVLHWRGFLQRRAAEPAGPFMQPLTPWRIEPDGECDGWVPLSAVNGSKMSPSDPATWSFSKPVRVRLKLSGRRGPTSRRCQITT